ncbi:rod-binding protein [Vampirovibrio chlorellavorus]|uniref:rod-binding protein n=1 Tax=Vampirovibrio chlorellavorus TaxID=758823 RepID=UPI0026F343D7|nr:rod-binding protein [Vampirovibrio chlorellavorus]
MDFNAPTSGTQWQGQAQTAKLLELQRQYQNPENQDQKKLKKAAQEFEAIFVQQMLDAMDKTIDRKDSFLNGGSSEEYFRSMLNEEISKSMTTKQGGSGFGLAESIYRQMAQNGKKNESGASGAMGAAPTMVQGTNGEVK